MFQIKFSPNSNPRSLPICHTRNGALKDRQTIERNWRQILSPIALLACLFSLLAACTPAGSSSQAQLKPASSVTLSQASPQATTVPSGTVLFQADWSQGLQGWQNTQGWKVELGQLVSDGIRESTLLAPYKVNVPNYAVEARVLVVQGGIRFALVAQKATNKDGFQASIFQLAKKAPFRGYAQVTTDTMNYRLLEANDYMPSTRWHTYRVEVRGPQAEFFIDGTDTSSAVSTASSVLSQGPLGLYANRVVVHISSFRIVAL